MQRLFEIVPTGLLCFLNHLIVLLYSVRRYGLHHHSEPNRHPGRHLKQRPLIRCHRKSNSVGTYCVYIVPCKWHSLLMFLHFQESLKSKRHLLSSVNQPYDLEYVLPLLTYAYCALQKLTPYHSMLRFLDRTLILSKPFP